MKTNREELALRQIAERILHVRAARERPAGTVFSRAASEQFGKVFFAICMTFVGAALAHVNARADIFAAVCVAAPGQPPDPIFPDMDIAVINATTGLRLPLPAGVNTTLQEQHPSITQDGKRLVFERTGNGTTRIIVVDLTTGASADLFTGFEIAQVRQTDPAFTPDGAKVVTCGPFNLPDGSRRPHITLTDLQSFPTGPFPHSRQVFDNRLDSLSVGARNPAIGGNLIAFTATVDRLTSQLFLTKLGVGGTLLPLVEAEGASQPAMSAKSPQILLFGFGGDILFRPLGITAPVVTPTRLPAIVNSANFESQPALTSDGRYVAFVRTTNDGHDRLFVWDSQTQTLLNANGVDLGAISTVFEGAVSLFTGTRAILTNSISGISTSSLTIRGTLSQTSSMGILVQRILGKTKSLGRRAFELETVGRFPLGEFPEGKLRATWDLTVDGQKLEPGRHLVTLRAVDGDVVRELGRPRVVHIPKRR